MASKRIPKIRTRVSNEADDDLGYLGCLTVDGDRVYATGGTYHKPTILVSDDGAQSWRALSTPATPGLRELVKVGSALYVVGEYGMLAVSVDSGLTWTSIPVDTQTCLFDVDRAPDGTWWIAGDDGTILRSADGISYQAVDIEDGPRFLGIRIVGGVVHVLGFDGLLRRWDGSAFTAITVDEGTPLTDLIVTRAGTWLLTSDGGNVFRSTDGGTTWEAAEVPTGDDLESLLETPQGILVVGNEGTLLFSDDDGKTFVNVPTDLDGHLWNITLFGGGYLISGDEGAVWAVDVSATETMTVELEADGDDEEDDDDDDDDDDEDEDDATPAHFDSIEEASARWIREGTAFADGLNAYVRRVYAVGPNKAGHEPSETRQDMADYVRGQLIALNAAGEHRRARTLFPPAYEPFDYDGLGQSIHSLMYLRDGRKLGCIAGSVYELSRDRIVPIEGPMGFGKSFDGRWIAKEYPDRIDIHDGWDGPVARSLPWGSSDITSLTVAPGGDAALVAGEDGIYWVTEHGAKSITPEQSIERISYAHAALSPNGRFVAMGTQDTAHVIVDRKTGRRHQYNPASSYPHYAAFHHDRPEVVLSSCHGLYGSASIAVDLDVMVAAKKKSARGFDQRAWVYAVASTSTGFLLGDRSGYIWALDFAGDQQWYAFVGSTITAMDISPDRTKLLVGQYAGIVIELDLTAKASDPRLLTDGPVADLQRWLFWQNTPPLIW